MSIVRFNLRVYGLLTNPQGHILVSDEITRGIRHTKFPGGGMELGEGSRETLIREFQEECGIEVEVREHLYTTDIFVPSAFDNDSQIISIYYRVQSASWDQIPVSNIPFDYPDGRGECFRWLPPQALLSEPYFILPLDRIVAEMLLA